MGVYQCFIKYLSSRMMGNIEIERRVNGKRYECEQIKNEKKKNIGKDSSYSVKPKETCQYQILHSLFESFPLIIRSLLFSPPNQPRRHSSQTLFIYCSRLSWNHNTYMYTFYFLRVFYLSIQRGMIIMKVGIFTFRFYYIQKQSVSYKKRPPKK